MNVYPFIEAEKSGDGNVKKASELLEVSRSAYYQQRTDRRTDRRTVREQSDADLSEQIHQLHQKSRGRYGAPRIHAELARQGRRHGRKRVARLMRTAGLRGKAPKRWKKTTVPDPGAAVPVDLIRRDFGVDAAKINSRWCGDITYINTWQGWLYLATVIDITSRCVVGYAMADYLRTDLIADALTNAVAARNPDPGVVFHSDRGCQGGFSRSSQHLDHGGVEWDDEGSRRRRHRSGRGGSGPRIGRCDRRCAHPGAPSHRVLCNGSSGA
ncbi:MAG TPA: IS3 family transposase [Nocardioidaceae bacterium]|nr:IS3 family transposase [Nocardioidaceae bacterium]